MGLVRRLAATTATTACALAGALLPGAAEAAPPAETSYCFAKHFTGTPVSYTWEGTWAPATPGCTDTTSGGTLTSTLTSATTVGDVERITIVWRFLRADGRLLFETVQAGTLSLTTGAVELAGVVTQGAHRGSATRDTGVPTDASFSYAGVMTVQPGVLPQARVGYSPEGCVGAAEPTTATDHDPYLDTVFGPEWGDLAGTSLLEQALTLDADGDGVVCVSLGTYWSRFPTYPMAVRVSDDLR